MTSATERASLLLEGAVRRKESIVSPEGVPMSVEVASYGDRLAAFILDSLFWTAATVLLFLAVLISGGMTWAAWRACRSRSLRPFSCATST